jgi:hypothetical protein
MIHSFTDHDVLPAQHHAGAQTRIFAFWRTGSPRKPPALDLLDLPLGPRTQHRLPSVEKVAYCEVRASRYGGRGAPQHPDMPGAIAEHLPLFDSSIGTHQCINEARATGSSTCWKPAAAFSYPLPIY